MAVGVDGVVRVSELSATKSWSVCDHEINKVGPTYTNEIEHLRPHHAGSMCLIVTHTMQVDAV